MQERSQKIVPESTTRKKKLAASVSPTEAKASEPPPTLAEESSASGASASAETPEGDGSTGPQLEPLVNTLRELNYRYLLCLHVWNLPQSDEAVVALVSSVHSYIVALRIVFKLSFVFVQSLFLESPLGPNLRVLEMRDCRLSVWAVGRLARCIAIRIYHHINHFMQSVML